MNSRVIGSSVSDLILPCVRAHIRDLTDLEVYNMVDDTVWLEVSNQAGFQVWRQIRNQIQQDLTIFKIAV